MWCLSVCVLSEALSVQWGCDKGRGESDWHYAWCRGHCNHRLWSLQREKPGDHSWTLGKHTTDTHWTAAPAQSIYIHTYSHLPSFIYPPFYSFIYSFIQLLYFFFFFIFLPTFFYFCPSIYLLIFLSPTFFISIIHLLFIFHAFMNY